MYIYTFYEKGEDKQNTFRKMCQRNTNYFPCTQKGTATGAQLRAWTAHFPRCVDKIIGGEKKEKRKKEKKKNISLVPSKNG